MNQMLSLQQAEELIASVGKEVTVHLRGQPGIGKSSMLKTLSNDSLTTSLCISTVQT